MDNNYYFTDFLYVSGVVALGVFIGLWVFFGSIGLLSSIIPIH